MAALPTMSEAFDAAKSSVGAAMAAGGSRAEPETPPGEAGAAASTPAAPVERGAEEAPAEPAAPREPASTSDAELDEIERQFAKDPVKLAEALKSALTKRTEALSELQGVEPYLDLIEQFQANPHDVLGKLATQYGYTLTPEQKTAEAVKPAVDATLSNFRQALGPDLEFLADKLAPAVQSMAEHIAKSTVEQLVNPIAQSQQTLISRAAEEQTATVLKAFEAKHPDWKQHEPALVKLGQQLQPNGMDELEYLETLYVLATRDRTVADATKKAVARMVKGAAEAEPRNDGTPESRVKQNPPARPTIREAFEAATRGERWG